jgi:hypothetical protein
LEGDSSKAGNTNQNGHNQAFRRNKHAAMAANLEGLNA